MDKANQKRITKEMIDSLQLRMDNLIDNGHIPDIWDGIELRQYLSDLAQRTFVVKMNLPRFREYKNSVIINPNL